jgi:hypothetical protein
VVATGQHKEMFRQVAETFSFAVDADLDVMRPNQTLAGLTAKLMDGIDGWLGSTPPDTPHLECSLGRGGCERLPGWPQTLGWGESRAHPGAPRGRNPRALRRTLLPPLRRLRALLRVQGRVHRHHERYSSWAERRKRPMGSSPNASAQCASPAWLAAPIRERKEHLARILQQAI